MKPYVLPLVLNLFRLRTIYPLNLYRLVKDEDRRILYWLFEYDPLTDSSNITFDDWIKMAKDIYVRR